jgi:hypothetical protein
MLRGVVLYYTVPAVGPDGTIMANLVDPAAAAAAAAGDTGPVMGLFGDQPELLLDPHTGMPADDNDYLQTTTITEVPTLSPGLAGTSSSAAAAAAAAAGVPVSQRMPISAGMTVFGPGGSSASLGLSAAAAMPPGVVVKESPTAALAAAQSAAAADHLAAAAAGPSSSVEAVLDQQAPRVDSPSGQFDMGMQDLLANLNTVNSSELMLTDDAKDDLWDMLFGRTSSGGLTADPAAAGVGGSVPLGVPSSSPLGMSALDALDGATAMSIGSPNLMGLDPAVAAAAHRQA